MTEIERKEQLAQAYTRGCVDALVDFLTTLAPEDKWSRIPVFIEEMAAYFVEEKLKKRPKKA